MSIKAVAGTVAVAAGEAALSSFFDKLFDTLSSSDLLKTFRRENFDADLRKCKRMLLKIQAVLDDAEEKQVTNRSVKIWLDELEDLAYDVDDILDEFATEALRRELNPEPKNKLQKLIDGCLGSDRDFVKQMRFKIEDIDRRLQTKVEDEKDPKWRENTGRRTITKTSREPSSSLVNESRTYGRNEDKKKIVKLLLESSDAQLFVIPIVGMGGLGKTTLAQLVFKDDEVSRYFDLKAWVSVSEDFDIPRLTKQILQCVTSESCHDDIESLQGKLQEKLSGQKFLLVLDDVWCENYEKWTTLRKPFESGAQGIKIVVTTRIYNVSSKMGTAPAYELKGLSHDACFRIFTYHALEATDFSEYPQLKKYDQKIVDRFKGSPLAAKALGGLLRNKHDPYVWEDVLNRKIWEIPEDESSIFSVLKLSYSYLPRHLKRCFAYCSLFPKDYEFEEADLVLLWMAEGLVQETKGEKTMEDLGGGYFRELLNRSFFQKSSRNESLFVMHDLMHDIAMWAAGDLCCRLEVQLGGSKQSEISTKVRHFSHIKLSNDCIQKFDEDVHLRTFLSLPLYNRYGFTKFDVKYCLIPQLRCLRVLSLSGHDIFELPSSIGDLKHLRYLNLSYTVIRILPESTSSLYNLQTLILKGCFHLTKLPEKIENLVNLRHLNISNASSIRKIPAGIAKLKSLRTLCLDMGKRQDWIPCRVEGKEFPCLYELSISNCPRLEGEFPHHLPSLEKLSIEACEQLVVSIPNHSVLQVLKIVGCKEVVHGSVKVEKLIIKNCEKLTSLCEDELMSFATLEIEIESCQSIVNIKLKSTLRTLTIKDCNALESLQFVMDECKEFSCLRELSISYCPRLEGEFSHHLRSLKKLSIYACKQLVVSIPSDSVLQELIIVGCKEVVHRSVKVEKLIIKNCEKLTSLCEDGLMSFATPEIQIESCQSLVNIKLKFTLRTLTIKDCSALESLQFVMDEGGASSTSSLLMNEENLNCIDNNNASLLEHLKISDCPSLKCVSTIVDLAAMLERLDIERCPNLTSLSSKGTLPTTLKVLWLDDCPKLKSIVDKLDKDTLLEDLLIYSCEKLRCLPRGLHELCHLKKIDIYKCNSLISLGDRDLLPTNLRSLKIDDCEKLEALPNNIHNLNFLQDLVIRYCPSIVSFPEEGFPTDLREPELHEHCHLKRINIYKCDSLISLGDLLPTNLRSLEIEYCEKLEALPNNIHNLNFLQDLLIRDCPSIVSFPEEGFPTDLRKLRLIGANLCKQVFELGLDRLTSLTSLEIAGGIMDSFPEEEDGKTMLMLPTSLTTLRFIYFPNLLFLSWKFFQNLSALEEISIWECPKLASLSEKCFPPSLQRLCIYDCPVLKQNCEKDKGIMWSKIANIPSVEIDDVEQQK